MVYESMLANVVSKHRWNVSKGMMATLLNADKWYKNKRDGVNEN